MTATPEEVATPHMPAAAQDRLARAYQDATVILEYGSGGSTELASAMTGKYVMSVESDRDWANALRQKIYRTYPQARTVVHHVDIGETGPWGRALTDHHWRDFHHYPNDIWDRPFFRQPDVILIDGRFRTACLAAALLRTTKAVTILFDDYVDRPKYHAVEQVIEPACYHDRMAEFHVRPGMATSAHISVLVEQYFQATLHGAGPNQYRAN